MKAEQRKEIEQNSLARWIRRLRSGESTTTKQTFYKWCFIIIAVLAVILAWNLFTGSRSRDKAESWLALEQIDGRLSPEESKGKTEKELEELREKKIESQLAELAQKHRDSLVGKTAKVRIARRALGPNGLDKLGTNDPEARKQAVAFIEKALATYSSVAPELGDNIVLQQEAWIGAAKAEEALCGIPKADGGEDSRGSIDKVIEYLQKAKQIAGDSPPGKELAKQIEDYTKNKDKLVKFYADVNRQLRTPKIPLGGGFPPLPPLKDPTP